MRLSPVAMSSLLLLGGCTPWGQPQEPVPPVPEVQEAEPIVRVDSVMVEVAPPEMAVMEERIAVLQLQLLERDAQNQRLADLLNEARQEVVRNMAKLQRQASRAEAASGMAEAEIAIQTLTAAREGTSAPEYAEARALLAQSTEQFDAGNFGGALYLATYARAAANSGMRSFARPGRRELLNGESLFALPIELSTTSRSNVRAGPGLHFPVEFVLDPDAPISGLSYSGAWVHIVDETGREGWIFHTLLDARHRLPEGLPGI